MATGTITNEMIHIKKLNVSYGTSVTNIKSGTAYIEAYQIGKIVFVGGYFATTQAWTSTLYNTIIGLPATYTQARFVASVGAGKNTVMYYSINNGWCISNSQGGTDLNFGFTYIVTD